MPYSNFANQVQISLFLIWFVLVALSHILSYLAIDSYSKEISKLCYPGEYKNILSGMGSYDKDADCSHGSGSGLSQEALYGFHYNLIAKPTTIEWDGPFGDYCPIALISVVVSLIITSITFVRTDGEDLSLSYAGRIIMFICLIAIPLFVFIPWQLKIPEQDDDGLVKDIKWENIDYKPFYFQLRIWAALITLIVMLMTFFSMLNFFKTIVSEEKKKEQ